ncbi:hypothetical protein C7999DRAFT_15230, partial [Corynascus novoguineensis]
DREAVCQRIASHWKDVIRKGAEEFIFGWPWDTKSFDDNHLVANIKLRILAGTFVPERLVTAIIAVMAWTDGELPNSWHLALTQLPGPRELLLREKALTGTAQQIDILSFHLNKTSAPPTFSANYHCPWINARPLKQQNSSEDGDDEWSEWDDAYRAGKEMEEDTGREHARQKANDGGLRQAV